MNTGQLTSSPEGVRIPDFLIIGAPKCGTTSLYHALRQHPEIFMPQLKEPRFFAFEGTRIDPADPVNRRTVTTLEDYVSLFTAAGENQVVGEASPAYLSSPCAAARIHHHLPQVKLLALLRNPIDRAYSHFLYAVQQGYEPASTTFESAIRAPTVEVNGWVRERPYLRDGFYARHLERYFERFSPEQIKIHLFEDLRADPDGLARSVFEWLGVRRDFVPQRSETRHARSGLPKSKLVHGLLSRPNPLRSLAGAALPKALGARLRTHLLHRNLAKPDMPASIRRELTDVFREDVLRLQSMIGRDLSAWLQPNRR